ncbi:hypothetical protein like AT1G25400 [Hibiscus trionum]|uniref:Uncharacterized protein n=1 Tax=Hibiscus trionum TaxID=183268 RepID=A0A9W7I6Q7_HIBTR|nr:hypothetical protein like AT1G25400 [Hibiscus trionum]
MEIPIINRISDFEDGISSSFCSRLCLLSGIQKIYGTHRFLKWGALILALIASVFTIINKLKVLIITRHPHSLPPQTLLYHTDFDIDSDSDIDSSSDSDDESEYEEPSTSRGRHQVGEFFRVRGSGSGSGHFVGDKCEEDGYFTSGKGVVKLWENLTLGFGFDVDESDDVLNGCGVNKGTNIASIFGGEGGFQAISAPFSSPAVVISAAVDLSSGRVAVGAWDSRLCSQVPAIVAEWRPRQSDSVQKIAAVNVDDGVQKVYVRSDVNGKLTVGDMRMVISSLKNLT